MMKEKHSAEKDNVVWMKFLNRPSFTRGDSSKFSWQDHLTFRNIVVALGLATFLIFLGSVVSARIAFLFAALLGLAGLVIYEMAARRVWEEALVEQLQRMNRDYERLVREVARNRNDMAVLKKSIATAGLQAQRQEVLPGAEAVEQRMIKALVGQLSRMADTAPVDDGAPTENIVDPKKVAAAPPGEEGAEALGQSLSDDEVLRLVQAAVKQDRIDLFIQPIVNLPQRKLRFYEMFSRIRIQKDVYLPARRYIEVAMQQDLVPVIDNLLLLRGLQMIRDAEEQNPGRAYFCNITSLTLNDPKFMGDIVEFITQNRTLAARLVFELGQEDLATMSHDVIPVLDGLAKLGCRFSMDQVRSASFDFAFLAARHVRFVKVEAGLILSDMKEMGGFQRLKRLKADMDSQGIDLIVEKIETEKDLLNLLDLDIDYGQGYLFGKADLYS